MFPDGGQHVFTGTRWHNWGKNMLWLKLQQYDDLQVLRLMSPRGYRVNFINLSSISLSAPPSRLLTHSPNSIGNRKETPEWGIKLLHCKVQLLVLLLVPMKLSVMVITPHLVLSWIAEWLKSEALQLAAGFYMLSVSSIKPHLSHEGHWVSTVL